MTDEMVISTTIILALWENGPVSPGPQLPQHRSLTNINPFRTSIIVVIRHQCNTGEVLVGTTFLHFAEPLSKAPDRAGMMHEFSSGIHNDKWQSTLNWHAVLIAV